MQRTCDATTMELLRGAVGRRLILLAARCSWDCLGYSEGIAVFSDGTALRLDFESALIAPMFDVFVARARAVAPDADPRDPGAWDRIELGDLDVVQAYVLRREEWVEPLSEPLTKGRGLLHHVGPLGARGEAGGGVEVDAGICFLGPYGAELSVEADFVHSFNLRYERAPPSPRTSRIPVVG